MNTSHESHSPGDTLELGRALGGSLCPGVVVGLVGPLGAGKTLLVKGIAAGNGLDDLSIVTSPTFTLAQEYPGRLTLYHLDVYRLATARDVWALGFDEMAEAGGAVLVEWADKVRELMPADTLWIEITPGGREDRSFVFEVSGQDGPAVRTLEALQTGLR